MSVPHSNNQQKCIAGKKKELGEAELAMTAAAAARGCHPTPLPSLRAVTRLRCPSLTATANKSVLQAKRRNWERQNWQ
jgi:hypothetical protein